MLERLRTCRKLRAATARLKYSWDLHKSTKNHRTTPIRFRPSFMTESAFGADGGWGPPPSPSPPPTFMNGSAPQAFHITLFDSPALNQSGLRHPLAARFATLHSGDLNNPHTPTQTSLRNHWKQFLTNWEPKVFSVCLSTSLAFLEMALGRPCGEP